MMEEWIGVAEKQAPPLVELGALYLCVRTDPALKVDKIRDTLSAALRDPESIGVRREGWHFSSMDTGRDPKVIRGEKWISTGDQATGFRLLECSSDGRLRFAVRMGREMFWGRTFEETQQSRTLHPYAISETVSACLQLFRHLFGSVAESNSSVWACLRFTNSEGWILRPYRPGRGGFEFPRSWHTATQQDGIASMVARDDIESFNKHPHRLAWLMLTQLYADFDHPEDAVPFYDRQTSRFTYD